MVNEKQKEKLKELLFDFQCAYCKRTYNFDNGRHELTSHHSNQIKKETVNFCSADCLDKWNHIKHKLAIL